MIYHAAVALGEAYVVVRADLRGFNRDLKQGLKEAVDTFERDFNKQISTDLRRSSERAGEEAGDGISRGMRRRLGNRRAPLWQEIPALLGSALDDGLSALPTEVKFAIVTGITLAAPFVVSGLAGAVTAGIGLGVVGIGVALASQFEEVKDRFAEFKSNIRNDLVESAVAFAPALINSLSTVEARIESWKPLLTSLFDRAAPLLEGLTSGVLDFLQKFLEGLDISFDDISKFVSDASAGFGELGDAVSFFIQQLASTGDKGRQAFRDLITAVAFLIRYVGVLVHNMVELYDIMRTIAEGSIIGSLMHLSDTIEALGYDTKVLGQRNSETTNTYQYLIDATEDEEKAAKEAMKAIKDQARAMDDLRNAAFETIDAQIAFEDSLDELTDKLKGGKDALRFDSDKGRDNLRLLSDAIRNAQRVAEDRFQRGKITAEEARKLYEREIGLIYDRAAAEGVSADQIKRVFDEAIKLVNLPPPSPDFWDTLAKRAAAVARELARAVRQAQRLRDMAKSGATIPWGAGSAAGATVEGMADGGMVTRDSLIRAGEGNRPEVVIPLTKPARAAQLAEQSGLNRILGNAGATLVQVFVGDEPLEQKMYRVVLGANQTSALALQYGPR